MYQKLMQYMQMAFGMAQENNPQMAQQIAMDMMQMNGGEMPNMGGEPLHITQTDNIGGIPKEEHAIVTKARQQSNDVAQPDADGAVNTKR